MLLMQGAIVLSSCLPSSLVDLDLSDNPALGKRGGGAIARFLLDFVRSVNLRRLDMSRCGLGDEGLTSLAEGLMSAPGLEWLGLAGNLRGESYKTGRESGKAALGKEVNSDVIMLRPRSGLCVSIAFSNSHPFISSLVVYNFRFASVD